MLAFKLSEVDPYQFVDSIFSLTVMLVDVNTDEIIEGETMSYSIYAAYYDEFLPFGRDECVPHLLEIVHKTDIQRNGTAQVQLCLKEVSLKHNNKRFILCVRSNITTGNIQVVKAVSNAITCVRHKLIIHEENTTPYVWYKDEGGKDKCIALKAMLIDSKKQLVRDRYVPLRALLTYSGGQPVQQQNILAVSPDSKSAIDGTGTALIKIRINEVSNRHRGQLFQVLISPDAQQVPSSADISPALSVPVEVKSKRNASARKQQDASQPQTLLPDPEIMPARCLLPLQAELSTSKRQRTDSEYQAGSEGAMLLAHPTGRPPLVPMSPYAQPPLPLALSRMPLHAASPCDLPRSGIPAVASTSTAIISDNGSHALTDPDTFDRGRGALKQIVDWVQCVLTAVADMQWIQIGVERQQHSEGSSSEGAGASGASFDSVFTDSSGGRFSDDRPLRPLYSMSNPNAQIQRIVDQYKGGVQQSLVALKSVISDRQTRTAQAQSQQQQEPGPLLPQMFQQMEPSFSNGFHGKSFGGLAQNSLGWVLPAEPSEVASPEVCQKQSAAVHEQLDQWENQVRLVVHRPVVLNDSKCGLANHSFGLPAFSTEQIDSSSRMIGALVGFYNFGFSEKDGESKVVFTARDGRYSQLNDANSSMSLAVAETLRDALNSQLDSRVFYRLSEYATAAPDASPSMLLQRLKEDVLCACLIADLDQWVVDAEDSAVNVNKKPDT